MPDYRVRPACSADLPYMQQAALQLDAFERPAQSESALQTKADFPELLLNWLSKLLEDHHALLLLAESEQAVPLGFIIGYVQSQPNPFTVYEQHGIIQLVWVEESQRRQGIARHLTETMESCFRELGVPYCEIQYAYANSTAARFWSEQGYHPDHVTSRKFLRN